jgi:maleylacetoacetate isomerase
VDRLKLYSYFRSSASYRVRIALHWKELPFEYIPIHLVKGAQTSEEYRKVNPMAHVPALDHNGFLVAESVAIIQYLDAIFPQQRMFPQSPREHATVMQVVEILNSGIQPLQNLKVLGYLESKRGFTQEDKNEWCRTWIGNGLRALEQILSRTAGSFCFGGEVTAADAFLIPQLFAARRFNVKTDDYPTLARVEATCVKLPAFVKAHPEKQPDYSA